ncbi:hypothetical protein [Modestobacter lapidis]|nr:hypothetical protein [Modestobacter lapidis]
MPAPCPPAPRGPALTRWFLTRGALVGVGLLAATTAAAPAALAAVDDVPPPEDAPQDVLDDAAGTAGPLVSVPPSVASAEVAGSPAAVAPAGPPIEPFFGRGKYSVSVEVAAPEGTAPGDLDLSDTRFTLTANGVEYTCSATPAGVCTFFLGMPAPDRIDLPGLPSGTHPVRQTRAAPGLEVAPGAGSIQLCDSPCGEVAPLTLSNASHYREQLTTTVRGTGGGPVRNTRVELGAPGYPHRPVQDDEPVRATPAPARLAAADSTPAGLASASRATPVTDRRTTGADGTVTFEGWFQPDDGYTLTPLTADDLPAGPPVTFSVARPSAGSGPLQVPPLVAPSLVGDPEPTATPAPVPAAAPVPTPAPTPAPAAAPPAAAPLAAAPPAAATPSSAPRSRGGSVSAAGPAATAVAPTSTPPPVSAAPPVPVAPPAPPSGRSAPTAPPVAVQPEAAPVETVGSSMPVLALGGGVALVVALVIGFAWSARRRARPLG